jgi:Spy/CpxP family protein refolding chaperone
MKKTLVVLSLAAIIVVGGTYVYAQGPGFGPRANCAGVGPRQDCPGFKGESALTPEQKTEFQQMREKFFNETAPLRETMRSKRLELRSLWTDPKADPKLIQEKETELRELSDQMKDKMVQLRLEARNTLTPEQLSQMGGCWGRGRGMGRGGF